MRLAPCASNRSFGPLTNLDTATVAASPAILALADRTLLIVEDDKAFL